MRTTGLLLILPVLLATALGSCAAQKAPGFRPGQWEIDTVQTVMGGRDITSQTQLCAARQIDFWQVAQAGLHCRTPKTNPGSGGLSVHVHCVYSEGPLHSDIRTEATEQIASDGNSFTLTGTTTTNTVYQGVQPKQTSATIKTSAHRIGPCR